MDANTAASRIVNSIGSAGYYTRIRRTGELGEQIICASHCVEGVYHGTSMWISCVHERWILGSFGYRQWLCSSEQNVVESCIDWLKSNSGPGAPPTAVIEKYELREFKEEEFDTFLATGIV